MDCEKNFARPSGGVSGRVAPIWYIARRSGGVGGKAMAMGGAGMQVLRSRRNSGRLAMAACALLALVIVCQLARLAWLFVPADDASLAAPLRSAGTAPAAPAVAVSKWHLFGAPPPRTAAAGPGAPMTTLALSLRGTLAESDPRSGLAVIAGADGSERAWRVGDEVAPGVTLDEVHADRVILRHGGVQEVLVLERHAAPAPAVKPGPAGAPLRNTASGTPAHVATAPISFAPPNIAHGAAGNWQQTLDRATGSDMASLVKNVQVTPVIDNGRVAGVRVATAGDGALLGRLGLRPSDIVTAVNGVPVDSVERGRQILESLGNASEVRVTVTRDGMPTVVSVKLR